MAYYSLSKSTQDNGSHGLLLGPPLLVALLFCFTFVMMQPDVTPGIRAASKRNTPQQSNQQSNLSNPSFTPRTPLPLINMPAAPQASTGGIVNLQAGSPNNNPPITTLSPSTPISLSQPKANATIKVQDSSPNSKTTTTPTKATVKAPTTTTKKK